MRIINHIKNKHYAKFGDILYIYKNVNKHFCKLVFTEDSKYDMGEDRDQYDWNKIIGKASWHRFFPFIEKIYNKRRETFITWRWRPDVQKFEVGKYFREGDKHWTVETFLVSVNELLIIKMDFFKDFVPVGAYFGGHDSDDNGIGGVAPNNLSYKIQFI